MVTRRALSAATIAVAFAALSACGTDSPVVQPIIETPPETSAAYPYEGIDEIELSIARAGDDRDLVSATFRTGEPIVLRDIPFGDDLVVHMRGLNSGSEIAYGRTCAVSLRSDSTVEPHLYFSRVVKWGPGAPMTQSGRIDGNAYSVTDGRDAVFVGGGATSIERFSAITGEFVELDAKTIARDDASLAALGNGRALIVGGVSQGSAVPMTEVIDPLATGDRQIDVQPGPALANTRAISLVDGSVLVSGGDEEINSSFSLSGKGFLFRLGDGDILEAPRQLSSTLTTARRLHAVTRLSDELGADVLITGGQDAADQALGTAELYRPLSQVFETVDGATMLVPRWGHKAVRLPGGFVLLVGGFTHDLLGGADIAVDQLELYDPVQGRFTDAGTLPINAGINSFSITRLPDGRYLIAGGLTVTGDAVATSFIVRRDPITGFVDVSRTDDMASARAGHSATLLCDGTVLLAGGSTTSAAPERYNPPATGRR